MPIADCHGLLSGNSIRFTLSLCCVSCTLCFHSSHADLRFCMKPREKGTQKIYRCETRQGIRGYDKALKWTQWLTRLDRFNQMYVHIGWYAQFHVCCYSSVSAEMCDWGIQSIARFVLVISKIWKFEDCWFYKIWKPQNFWFWNFQSVWKLALDLPAKLHYD